MSQELKYVEPEGEKKTERLQSGENGLENGLF